MRYWHPLTQEAAAAVREAALDELVLLPLYPHYSFATTGSSLKEWKRLYRPGNSAPPARLVEHFHTTVVRGSHRREDLHRTDPFPKARTGVPDF